jgi:hypothetical protein
MPSTRARVLVAVATALAAVVVCLVRQRQTGPPSDFAMFWTAARVLLDGGDPYAAIRPGGIWHWESGYLYPLPAAVVLIPFLPLSPAIAAVVFSSLAMGVFAFAITREDWSRWPILMSAPALWAVSAGQWAPLVSAAAMTPAFAWAAAVKPTIGLACFARMPTWRFIVIGCVLVLVSFLFLPDWPLRWLHATRTLQASEAYHVPLLMPLGFVLGLAALGWRDPDARLLLVMSVVPQTMVMYDQLVLGVIARTRIQAYIFSLWSYMVLALAVLLRPARDLDKLGTMHYLAHALTWGYYLPLLVVVLMRRYSKHTGSVADAP